MRFGNWCDAIPPPCVSRQETPPPDGRCRRFLHSAQNAVTWPTLPRTPSLQLCRWCAQSAFSNLAIRRWAPVPRRFRWPVFSVGPSRANQSWTLAAPPPAVFHPPGTPSLSRSGLGKDWPPGGWERRPHLASTSMQIVVVRAPMAYLFRYRDQLPTPGNPPLPIYLLIQIADVGRPASATRRHGDNQA